MRIHRSPSPQDAGAPATKRPARPGGLAALALAAVVAIVVAGCGEGSSSTTQASTSASVATTASAPTTASTAPTPTTSTSTTTSTPTTPTSTTPRSKGPLGLSGPQAGKARRGLGALAKGFGAISISSTAFSPGGSIETRYTCDGEGISPPLQWQGVPKSAKELYLLAADIGGGPNVAVQWAVAMPASTSSLPAGSLPPGAVAGVNSAGKIGWAGVCGSKGKVQHVSFLMYALSKKLGLQSGFNPAQVRSELKGRVALGFTVASYERK